MGMEGKEQFPLTKECHCGRTAHKYFTRTFINQMDYKVFRIFYRCENCWSRIHSDFIPELDAKDLIDVLDLMKTYNQNPQPLDQ